MHKKIILFTLAIGYFLNLSAQNSGSIYRQLEKLNF